MDDIHDMIMEKEIVMVAMANNLDDHCKVQCRMCHHIYSIMYNREDMVNWLSGSGFIQDIMSYLTDGERELLISGTCSTCFDKIFPPDVDNDA
jgi:hypothetical protein